MSRIGDHAASGGGNRTQQQHQHQSGPDVFSGQVDAARAHADILRGLDGKQVCPFCGSVSEKTSAACARCGMENTPDARKATKARIGPWYVLQARNPAAPGMRFETLLTFVRKGRVRARSVVRGPTTHQLWRFAAHVKGLSREFGLCFSCGSPIETTANVCPQCNRLQEPPLNPDALLEDEDGGPRAPAPIYRELPAPQAPPPEPEPTPEELELVIPAFGAAPAAPPPAPPEELVVPTKPIEIPPTKSAPPTPSVFKTNPEPLPDFFSPPATKPAPAAENPFAINGGNAPPRKKPAEGGVGGGFLSAKELAAAFKLSFDPSANMDAVEIPDDRIPAGVLPEDDGLRPGQMMSTAQLPGRAFASPDAHQPRVEKPNRRRSAFAKFLFFLVILGGTGFGVLLWVDPNFRGQTVDWFTSLAAKVQGMATRRSDKPSNIVAPASTEPKVDEFDVPMPPTPTSETQAGAKTSAPPNPTPATRPVEIVTPQQKPADVRTPPAPKPATPPPTVEEPVASDTPEALDERMKQIRREALADEGKGDYKSALKKWQEMGKLPPEHRDRRYDGHLEWLKQQVNK
jgi:hypothetical protein